MEFKETPKDKLIGDEKTNKERTPEDNSNKETHNDKFRNEEKSTEDNSNKETTNDKFINEEKSTEDNSNKETPNDEFINEEKSTEDNSNKEITNDECIIEKRTNQEKKNEDNSNKENNFEDSETIIFRRTRDAEIKEMLNLPDVETTEMRMKSVKINLLDNFYPNRDEDLKIECPYNDLPFENRIYYLNVTLHKPQIEWLDIMVKSLGGKLVLFFDKNVTHIITDPSETPQGSISLIPKQPWAYPTVKKIHRYMSISKIQSSLLSSKVMVPSPTVNRKPLSKKPKKPGLEIMTRGRAMQKLSIELNKRSKEDKKENGQNRNFKGDKKEGVSNRNLHADKKVSEPNRNLQGDEKEYEPSRNLQIVDKEYGQSENMQGETKDDRPNRMLQGDKQIDDLCRKFQEDKKEKEQSGNLQIDKKEGRPNRELQEYIKEDDHSRTLQENKKEHEQNRKLQGDNEENGLSGNLQVDKEEDKKEPVIVHLYDLIRNMRFLIRKQQWIANKRCDLFISSPTKTDQNTREGNDISNNKLKDGKPNDECAEPNIERGQSALMNQYHLVPFNESVSINLNNSQSSIVDQDSTRETTTEKCSKKRKLEDTSENEMDFSRQKMSDD